MCGIVGVAGDMTQKDTRIFEDLLDVVQLRGRHSTGVVNVPRGKEQDYEWVKRVGPPVFLKDSKEYDESMRGLSKVLIGHGRHKTVGEIDNKSAHPFDFPDRKLVGVHNGTLKNFYRFDEHTPGNVDSYTLYRRMANIGAEALFSDLDGAWACVWWDGESQELCLIRNKERPLTFAYSQDRRRMYWASEAWMLGAVYRQTELWEGKDGKQSPYHSLTPDVIYRIKIDPFAAKNKPVFQIKEGKKIEKKPQPSRTTNTQMKTGSASGGNNNTKNEGGEVANPFLDDQLPDFLTTAASPKPSENATKPSSSQKNSNTSTTNSKDSSEQEKRRRSTSSGGKNSKSQPSSNLPGSQKTRKRKLSVVQSKPNENGWFKPTYNDGSDAQPDTGRIYNAHVGADTRYIRAVDTEYITNLRTGKELTEKEFREQTGGNCCHCKEEIHSVIEVHEIFDEGDRFICKSCVTPPTPQLVENTGT